MGEGEVKTCGACDGSGMCQDCEPYEGSDQNGDTCSACDGSMECITCDGTGEEEDDE